jgi:hypothetical protein
MRVLNALIPDPQLTDRREHLFVCLDAVESNLGHGVESRSKMNARSLSATAFGALI